MASPAAHERRRGISSRPAEPAGSWCEDDEDDDDDEEGFDARPSSSSARPPPPPPPPPAAANTATAAPEADECVICLEPWSSEGPHRVAALRRCGHLFGASCIRAAAAASGRCPLCNEPCSADGDVINLFVAGDAARISAADGAAAAAAERVAAAEQAARAAAERALGSARAEVKRLRAELRKAARANARLVALLGSSTSMNNGQRTAVGDGTGGTGAAAAALVDEGGRPLPSLPPPPPPRPSSPPHPPVAPKRARAEGGAVVGGGAAEARTTRGEERSSSSAAAAAPPPPFALPFFRASVTTLPAAFDARCVAADARAGVAVVGGDACVAGGRRAQLQVVSLLAPRCPSSSVLLAEGGSVSDVALGPDGKTALAAVVGSGFAPWLGSLGTGQQQQQRSPSLSLVSLEASAVALRVPTARHVSSAAWLGEHVVAAGLGGGRVAVFDLRMASSSSSSSWSGGGGRAPSSSLSPSSSPPSVQGAAARGLLAELYRRRPRIPSAATATAAPSHVHTLLPVEGGRTLLAASAAGVELWEDRHWLEPGSPPPLPRLFAPPRDNLWCVGVAADPSASYERQQLQQQQQQQQQQPLVVASFCAPPVGGAPSPSLPSPVPEHHLLRLAASSPSSSSSSSSFSSALEPSGRLLAGGAVGGWPLGTRPALLRATSGGGLAAADAGGGGEGGEEGGGGGGGRLLLALPDGASVGLWDAESAAAAAAEAAAAASPARPLAWTQPHNCAVRCVAAMEGAPGGSRGGGSSGAFVSLSSRQLHVYRRRR